VEKVAEGFGFTEGPVFSRRGYLLFSDLRARRILQWERGKVTVFRENSNGSNGLTFDHQGRLLAAERNRVTRTEKDGRITVLAEAQYPNDLVYAIDGSIYFTDHPAGVVYQITRRGEVRAVARDCRSPNGVALAPDQQKLYIADMKAGQLRVYRIEPDGGLSEGRVLAAVPGPDGLKTDESGAVWVASDDGIVVFDAEGRRTATYAVPERPSNCAWGEGFRNLYITARTSVYLLKTAAAGTRTY